MADPGFVHLHVHSSYSLLEGALTIARLAELAKADRQPALALTDTDNMFGALEFSEKLAGSGIQPIVGCALAVDFGDQDSTARHSGVATAPARPRIVLLAAREDGYRSLMRLNSRAFLETPAERSAAHQARLARGRDRRPDRADRRSGRSARRRDRRRQRHAGGVALRRAASVCSATGSTSSCSATASRASASPSRRWSTWPTRKGIPLVATNEPYFATREDYEAHDALICIAEGRLVAETDRRQLTAEHRFKTRAEMAALFADLPEALASTVEIARRCAYPAADARRRSCRASRSARIMRRSTRRAELRRQAATGLERRHRRAWARARPHRRGLPRAARLRARRDRGDEISRLLPDRRRLHPVGEDARHPGRAGPRLRRRFARRLCADHHRSRSDPLRAAVRALPQSRARVDAGLRHRLLPGPPRRGDPLRAGQIRPRPGGADHHLRHAAGARRAARRRPRAADAVRAGRQALQAGAAEPGQPGDAQARDRRRAAAAGRARPRAGGARAPSTSRRSSKACTATPRRTPPAS